ncbi:hypothetical protein K5I29_10830 [Flavobacterium agricola]|uniref:Outer membrane protein beta-barrel domain-containing protein n=1 Tax=Flavobacterium agricola TaxID=2870839 RepID=A0ABY6M1I5_9FLAO|nr:hypothetical protein [Flavobacterium agricola]UYW00981.1 hypothetical protein K5I29_10830 [Flavobacterium agricola]
MKKIKTIAVLICSFAPIMVFSQNAWRGGNRIGLIAGPNFTHVFSSCLQTQDKMGWTAGAQIRGNIHNYWSGIYGIRFYESNFGVATTSVNGEAQEVIFTNRGAHVNILMSYVLVPKHISIDIGPVLQINNNLALKRGVENNVINGTALTTKDVIKVTPINGLVYVGATLGINSIRANINYTLGVNNFFSKLNKDDDLVRRNNNQKFTGRTGVLSCVLQINL